MSIPGVIDIDGSELSMDNKQKTVNDSGFGLDLLEASPDGGIEADCGYDKQSPPATQATDTETEHLTRDEIEASLSQCMEEFKKKREADLNIISEVKKEIMRQAGKTCEMLEQRLYAMHETQGRQIDDKVAALTATLDKVKRNECELDKSRELLRGLCSQMLQKYATDDVTE